ncbi:MAG: PEP-CTERM sorting domain-containing protein [Akkermansia sp.]
MITLAYCSFSICVADVPTWVDVGLSVADGESVSGLAASESLNANTSSDGMVCGISLSAGGSIGTISGEVNIGSASPSAVSYLVGNLSEYSGIGFYNEATGDSQGFDIDWAQLNLRTQLTAGSDSDYAYGVLLKEATSIATGQGEFIGGSILATNSAQSNGHSVALDIRAGSQVGDIASGAYILAYNEGTGRSCALRVTEGSSVGELAGTFIASTQSGDAMTIRVVDGGTIGTISGSIQAISEGGGSATAIYSNTEDTLVFADGASVTTQEGDMVTATYGMAIVNSSYGIKMTSLSGVTSIEGNLNAGQEAIQFVSGEFSVASDLWKADSITVGSGTLTSMEIAKVTMTGSTELTATTLNFYVSGSEDYSLLSVSGGESVTLTSVEVINVYLEDSLLASGDFELKLIEGSIVGLSESVVINYIVGDAYREAQLSVSSGGEADLVLSGGFAVIPEPATLSLSLLGLLVVLRRRRRG